MQRLAADGEREARQRGADAFVDKARPLDDVLAAMVVTHAGDA